MVYRWTSGEQYQTGYAEQLLQFCPLNHNRRFNGLLLQMQKLFRSSSCFELFRNQILNKLKQDEERKSFLHLKEQSIKASIMIQGTKL